MATPPPTGSCAPGASRRASISSRGRTGSSARRWAFSTCRRGAKLAGSGFPLLRGLGARLVRALGNFMLDLHTREHGYAEVAPPYLVNRATLTGTGQLPKFEEDLYALPPDDLFLIPTAEVPLTNIHRDEILEAARRCRAATAPGRPASGARRARTARTRAGSSGCTSSTRWSWCASRAPRTRPAEHELLTGPRGDGAPAARDSVPRGRARRGRHRVRQRAHLRSRGLGRRASATWLEASSSSTFTDFQARRANIRYRPEPKAKPEFVHTLNASGVAFPRTIIALLENNQAADGSVRVPEALVPYLGVDRLAPRA